MALLMTPRHACNLYSTLELPRLSDDRTLPRCNSPLHVFVDRSIVEVFGAEGRAVVTARVYPNPESASVAVFNAGKGSATVLAVDGYQMGNATEPR